MAQRRGRESNNKDSLKNLTLGRDDLLTEKHGRKSLPFMPINGYVAFAGNSPNVLKIVVFFEGMRLKGYLPLCDLRRLIEEKGSVTIHRKWLKEWRGL